MLTLALFFTEASRRWAGPHEEDGGGGGSQAEEGQGLDTGVRHMKKMGAAVAHRQKKGRDSTQVSDA
jgi:hypothetical protein